MPTYALINTNGIVQQIVRAQTAPKAPHGFVKFVEQTNITFVVGKQYIKYAFQPPQDNITPNDLWNRFTPTEYNALMQNAMTNSAVNGWVVKLNGMTNIDVKSNDVKEAFGLFITSGILTQDRSKEILK